ncbi:hypothetical protein IMSHALPRED_001662 [Imshaugia aleurites]|uniref:Uncharacterized protein n=1 Tax=Imshaugia aleurites TaxID=172621 RepID=A0A8H3J372_9LECA|nr:hypothetical protein IMSHALPRED_001662 [Imshaugia aleurites]
MYGPLRRGTVSGHCGAGAYQSVTTSITSSTTVDSTGRFHASVHQQTRYEASPGCGARVAIAPSPYHNNGGWDIDSLSDDGRGRIFVCDDSSDDDDDDDVPSATRMLSKVSLGGRDTNRESASARRLTGASRTTGAPRITGSSAVPRIEESRYTSSSRPSDSHSRHTNSRHPPSSRPSDARYPPSSSRRPTDSRYPPSSSRHTSSRVPSSRQIEYRPSASTSHSHSRPSEISSSSRHPSSRPSAYDAPTRSSRRSTVTPGNALVPYGERASHATSRDTRSSRRDTVSRR